MAEKFEDLVDMFVKSTDRYRDKLLMGVKKSGAYQWITYGEVRRRVDNFRAGMAARGVGAGDSVAIIANNGPEWAIAAYATYGLGAYFVAMYPSQQPKDWKFILNDCGAKALVVANSEIAADIAGIRGELEVLEHVFEVGGGDDNSFEAVEKAGEAKPSEPVNPDAGDIACLIYTSGTTGNPKGVRLSHGNIVSNINAVHEIFPMSGDDRSLSFLPWAHSFGQTCELHCLLSLGASMGLAESVPEIINNLAEVKPTLLFSVPRIFNKIYAGVLAKMEANPPFVQKLFRRGMELATAQRTRKLGSLEKAKLWLADKVVFSKIRARFGGRMRYAFSGGAAISKEVATFIDNLGIVVYEGYGLSETSPIACANYPNNRKIGSVGKAIPEVRIEIDKAAAGNPEGDEGEIVIHGPNVMQGYHNLPDKTKEVIREDGGFRTGDLGRMDDEGYVFITGRIKEQYKLENGKYVAPAPMEEKYKLSPLINQVMVYGMNRPFNVAIVVPDLANLKTWAASEGVNGADPQQLCDDPKTVARMEKELEDFGKDFKGYERVRKVKLIAEEFSEKNDMLTPTMKLKRRNVIKTYEGTLNKLYE